MRKKNYLFTNTVGIATILFLSSCRSSELENTLSVGGSSAVNFKLLGTEYADSVKLSGQASLAKGGGGKFRRSASASQCTNHSQ